MEDKPFTCGRCGAGYDIMVDYSNHKNVCIPDEDFGITPEEEQMEGI